MTDYTIKRTAEGYHCKFRGVMFHVADTRPAADAAIRMHVAARVKAQNKAILAPALAAEAAATYSAGDESGNFGDGTDDDYRAWPNPEQARKLRAERVDYNACPYCGRSPCSGTHADCRSL